MELIMLSPDSKEPLYIQLYKHFKGEIENSRLSEGEKLPSIRGLAKSLAVSKITVEKAYQQLMSEGYIENCDRSRYRVNNYEGIAFKAAWPADTQAAASTVEIEEGTVFYDFASGEMDIDGFNFSLWKRYVSKVFANKERLVGYGNIQGEEELRSEIAKYVHNSRGGKVSKEQIIIGPGVQSLLNTLCSILKADTSSIAFEEPGFKNGRHIFADHGFQIIPIKMKTDGIDMEELVASKTRLVYVSPSHQFPTGYIMPIGKRNRLLRWAEEVEATIIEDDYDSEFRYFGRPIPALKGLDYGENVVYLGSFSKVMPPSMRISYMVLPDRLLPVYHKNSSLYNQAASTIEQLALAKFMGDGHLERQIRRLRKLYYEKSLLFFDALKRVFGRLVEVNETESGLHTLITVHSELTAQELVDRAMAKGCRVASVQDYYWENTPEKQPRMILYFSKIPAGNMLQAVQLLKEAWFPAGELGAGNSGTRIMSAGRRERKK